MTPNTASNFDHCEPLKAEPLCKSNDCYFHRHTGCFAPELCDCECHQKEEN